MRLMGSERDLLYRTPRSRVDRLRTSLGQSMRRFESAVNDSLRLKRRCLERAMDRVEAMSPLKILRRGYSIVRRIPSMEIVREARSVKRGDKLDVKLSQGGLVCSVEKTKRSERNPDEPESIVPTEGCQSPKFETNSNTK